MDVHFYTEILSKTSKGHATTREKLIVLSYSLHAAHRSNSGDYLSVLQGILEKRHPG